MQGGTNRSDGGEIRQTSGLGGSGRGKAAGEEVGTPSSEVAEGGWRRSTATGLAGWGRAETDRVRAEDERSEEDGVERAGGSRGDDGETRNMSGLGSSGRDGTVGREDGTPQAEASNEEEAGAEEEAEVFVTGEVHEEQTEYEILPKSGK